MGRKLLGTALALCFLYVFIPAVRTGDQMASEGHHEAEPS